MKMQTRLFVIILGVFAVIFTGVIAFIVQSTTRSAINNARQYAETEAMVHANEVKAVLEVGMDAARTLAYSMEGLKEAGFTDRDAVNSMLRRVLEKHPDFIGVWTCWEAGAFDNDDAAYVNTTGHDASGRFVPFWSRDASGRITILPLEGYELAGEGDYYQLPLTTGQETLLEPYDYPVGNEIVTVTTMSVPIFVGNRVVGVAGVDISLNRLEEITNAVRLYQTGFGRIISHEGILVTHPTPGRAGEMAGELTIDNDEAREAWDAIRRGKVISQVSYSVALGTDMFKSMVPICVGNTGTPWSFGTVIPENEILAETRRLTLIILSVGLLGLVIMGVVLWFITRPIVRNVKDSTAFVVNCLAKGDFSIDVPEYAVKLKDEYGELARGFAAMLHSLRESFSTIGAGQHKVSASSESLAASSQQMSASLEEVAASANEFSGNAQALSSSAQEMGELGNRTSRQALEGNAAVENAVSEMHEISDIVNSLKDVVGALGSRAQDISKIVVTIKSIADQTNLLALNAAIEAARAGEQGRGFSVVADEVRKLAEQSSGSASEITDLVGDIDKQIQEVMQRMDTGVTRVDKGTEVVLGAGEVLKSITASLDDIAHQIEQVSSAAQEIGAGSEEVSAAVEEQTATMNEISGAAMELQGLVNELESALGRVKY